MSAIATKSTTVCSLAEFKAWLGLKSRQTKTISALTSAGTVATATCAAHGYETGDFGVIAGVVTAGYVGSYCLTVVDENTFTFVLDASASSPASGTMTVTIDDGRYAGIVDAASEEIESVTGMYFVTRTVTDTFDGTDKTKMFTRFNPIADVSITINDAAVASSTFAYDAERGIVSLKSGIFTSGIQNCAVSYDAGYDDQDGPLLPSDVVRAAKDLAKAILDELVSNAIAASSINLGPSNIVIKTSKYPQSVRRVIDVWTVAKP